MTITKLKKCTRACDACNKQIDKGIIYEIKYTTRGKLNKYVCPDCFKTIEKAIELGHLNALITRK